MPKTCVNHKDVAAATMCHQCHKPICPPCTVVAPMGSFCSPECNILYREFKGKLEEPKPRSGLGNFVKAFVALALVVVVFFGIHQAAERIPALKKIDVIGLFTAVLNRRSDGKPD